MPATLQAAASAAAAAAGLLLCGLSASAAAAAAASPSALAVSNTLGSHMVLQRNRPAPIWGWGTPGATVSVQLQDSPAPPATARADASTGFWRVVLPAQNASSTGRSITVSSSGDDDDTVVLTDVLFGEVILCSGQSNMEFTVPSAVNATAEIAAADAYPHVRFTSGPVQNLDRLNTTDGIFNKSHDQLLFVNQPWAVASSETVGGCSAVGGGKCDECCGSKYPGQAGDGREGITTGSYLSAVCWFAARDLADLLGNVVPVGAVVQSYGGTSIQFWMGPQSLAASAAPTGGQCCGQDGGPSCLYNTQVYPYTLGPMQFSAALFYQGEQNANCGGPTQTANATYSTMLQAMVLEWRTVLKQPALPFGAVLLAPWRKDQDAQSFALLRLAQANLTAAVDRTFVVNTLDQGDPASFQVHSPYKQAVGRRAAEGIALATGLVTEEPFAPPPAYESASVVPQTTAQVMVTLAPAGLGGQAPVVNASVACPEALANTSNCAGFEVLAWNGMPAGGNPSSSNCTWFPAAVNNLGVSSQLLLSATTPDGSQAVATRAYFANWPVASVGNAGGNPLVPWMEYIDPTDTAAHVACPLPQ